MTRNSASRDTDSLLQKDLLRVVLSARTRKWAVGTPPSRPYPDPWCCAILRKHRNLCFVGR